ncbi:unnamed protein product [Amaranthus hypochondriacus]
MFVASSECVAGCCCLSAGLLAFSHLLRAGVFLLLKELCWPIITCCYFVLLAMYGMRRLLFCSAGCYLCDAALVSCAVGWLVGLWG